MALSCYHATTSKAASEIEKTQFLPGKRGYAGAAIYFSADPQSAIHHCFNGATRYKVKSKTAEVVISCSVDLGKCLSAGKHAVDKDECYARGYDSVRIKGTDTYAVYDSSRISIQEFRRIRDDVCWYPSTAPPSVDPLEIIIAAIQASPNGSLDVSSKMGELYTQHPSLRKALRAAGGLTDFCNGHSELSKDGHIVTMGKAKPLDILVAAIQASPNGLNATSDISQLCLKHPDLHEGLRAAGGLKGFCDAHPELTRDGPRVVLSKQLDQLQQQKMKREEVAQQMHVKVRHQAAEERRQMQLQIEMRLKEEAELERVELQREEAARLREAARPQAAEETRQQMQLQKETRLKEEARQEAWQLELRKQEAAREHEAQRLQLQKKMLDTRREAQELHMKNLNAARQQVQVRMEQEQEASQGRQLQLKREEASRQMLMQQEGVSHMQKPLGLKRDGESQSRLNREDQVRLQLWEARHGRQLLQRQHEQDARQQQQLQLKDVPVLGCLPAGLLYLLGLVGVQ